MALIPTRSTFTWAVAMTLFALLVAVGAARETDETDARFEKLVKEIYPKAKQEGSLVVYTIWDVEHIQSIVAVFRKRFPGIETRLAGQTL